MTKVNDKEAMNVPGILKQKFYNIKERHKGRYKEVGKEAKTNR